MLLFFSFLACQDSNQPSQNVEPKETTSDNKKEKPSVDSTVQDCTYTITQAKPEWTAYKYTEKAAVGGTFNTFTLSPAKPSSSFSGALQGISIEIDASSVESYNPSRNTTIAEKYCACLGVRGQAHSRTSSPPWACAWRRATRQKGRHSRTRRRAAQRRC